MANDTKDSTGDFNAVDYDATQATQDAEREEMTTGTNAGKPKVDASDIQDATDTGEIDVVVSDTAATPADEVSDGELKEFEQYIDEILATGELDETLRIIDAEGVAQVLPVLDSEPISHLLDGVEEVGGRANVFVRTSDGIAVLSVMEYSPDDPDADDTPTGETPAVTADTVEETEEATEGAEPAR